MTCSARVRLTRTRARWYDFITTTTKGHTVIHDLRTAPGDNDAIMEFHVRDHDGDVILFSRVDDEDDTAVNTYAVLALDPRDTNDALSIYYADAATTNSDAYDATVVPTAIAALAARLF